MSKKHRHQWGPIFSVLDRDMDCFVVGWYSVLWCRCGAIKPGDWVILTDAERVAMGRGAGWLA